MNRKSAAFSAFFRSYVRFRMGRAFDAVRVRGVETLARELERRPLILACNHVAWWDPLFLVLLDGLLAADAYCLMDAKNLERFPFFAWVGAVPLDRSRKKAAYRDLLRSVELLDRPGRLLIVFPQGRQRPAHLPLDFAPGVEVLARKAGIAVVPMALRYDYREEPRPELNASIGALLPAPTEGGTFLGDLESAVSGELRRIDHHLESQDPEFIRVIGGKSQRVPLGARALRLLGARSEDRGAPPGAPE